MYGSMSCKEAAIEAVKASAQARMAADLTKVPKGPLREFFRFMIANIFVAGMTIEKAKEETGFHDNSVSTRFKPYLRKTLGKYIRDLRMEVANRLLRNLELDVGETGEAIGMNALTSFSSAFLSWSGVRPSTVIGKKLPPEAGDPADADLGPPPSMLEGPQWERWRAEDLWRQMRHRPLEKQRSAVGWHLFHTPALFDLLRRKSRQEGRRDREFGIHLAELALLSLRRCEEGWSDRGHDLRAKGLAELGNTKRLAGDLTAAEGEFVSCWAEWRKPRDSRDPSIEAEICFLHGTLRMFQRRYNEALELVNRSLSLFENQGDRRGQAQALIQRAAIRGYTGQGEESMTDFRKAADLIDNEKEQFLAFGVTISLANGRVRAGEYDSSRQEIAKAKQLFGRLDFPLGMSEIEWVEGFLAHETGDLAGAEKLYLAARSRYLDAEERLPATLLSLDLTILYCDQQRHDEAIELAAEILPALHSLKLHPESLEAIAMLAKAVAEKDVSRTLLRSIRDRIQHDPLSKLV